MPDKRQLEFFVLRYVPDAVKEEFVNIGVAMFESGANGEGFADVRFTRDWRSVRCLDPQADVEMLESIEQDLRRQIVDLHDREMLLRKLHDQFSNAIQVTAMKACEAEDPRAEIETLARLYVERPKPERMRVLTGRERILEAMQNAFEQANVWGSLDRNIPVSKYTVEGDDFVIDCGYDVANTTKLFHAVSLRRSVDQAVNLAYRYPKIKAGMKDAIPSLTAVVDDHLNRSDQQIKFAFGMLGDATIKVATVSTMPDIADVARRELHV
jgi:hypothetical protein